MAFWGFSKQDIVDELAYRTYCNYYGCAPSFEVESEGPCFVCWYDISSPVPKYINGHDDEDPKLGIHDSCSKLPSSITNHPFHSQHTLILHTRPTYDSGTFMCHACGRISWAFNFHCEICRFDLDIHCATLLTQIKSLDRREENQIQHLNHPHTLMICRRDHMSNLPCSGCKKPFDGFSIYVCLQCHCLLHESCADLPSHIEHPFHSQHPLILLIRPSIDPSQTRCDACGRVIDGFSFHCSECKFSLDPTCALFMPTQDYVRGMELRTRKSNHPRQIDHPFHPNHPLMMLVKHDPGSSRCKACGKGLKGHIFYCSECDFGLDLFCAALMPSQISKDQQLGHPHPLTLCKNKENFDFTCYACQLRIQDSVYVCLECSILLHRSCANLPLKIHQLPHHKHSDLCHNRSLTLLKQSPCQLDDPFEDLQLFWLPEMHPLHPKYDRSITRQLAGPNPKDELDSHFKCSECFRDSIGFAYACSRCSDYFDIRCTMKKSKPHEHPLAFFNIKSNNLNCEVCCRPLRTPFFRCEKCNFNIHASCIPILPQIVKHVCHRHTLTLTYSPVKDYPDEAENAEFYCDVCEEPRELFDPTYYCEECHFVSHVHCGFSKELGVLVEEWSLSLKLKETKLGMFEANANTHKGLKLESIAEVDGAETVSISSRTRFSDFSTDDKIKAKGVLLSRFAGNHSSLLELDEEIAVVCGTIKGLDTEISTMSKRKEKFEGSLEELEERRASSEFLPLFS